MGARAAAVAETGPWDPAAGRRDPPDLAALVETVRAALRGAVPAAAREAEWLVAGVLGCRREDLRRGGEVSAADADRVRDAARRRAAGEPLAYVLGEEEFYGRQLVVRPGVLVPRPETELLVDEIRRRARGGVIADVGTGSGAIAVCAQLEVEGSTRLLALDRDARALEVTGENLRRHGLTRRVARVRGDLLEACAARSLAGVVSNPPYVEPHEHDRLPREVRTFEPRAALVPREGSARALRQRLIAGAARVLRPGGFLALEVGAGQAGVARTQLLAAGFRQLVIRNDLAGIGRVVVGVLPGDATRADARG